MTVSGSAPSDASDLSNARQARIARRPFPVTSRVAAILAPLYLIGHLFFLPPALEDIDSINFALGLHDYDPAQHQPHPPGYPVYMALGTQDWMRSVMEMAARTDSEGRFALSDVPDGNFRIRAQAAGYPEVRHWAYLPSQKFVRLELRPGGIVMGPTQMMLADTAAYLAILARVGEAGLAVTTGLEVHFLRAAPPGDVLADARLLKLGRRLAVAVVEITSAVTGRQVAHATVSYAMP